MGSYLSPHQLRVFILSLLGADVCRGAVLYHGLEVRSPRNLHLGANTSIGDSCTLDARGGLWVGECVNLSTGVQVWTLQHDYRDQGFATVAKSVRIEDYAWLSARSIIIPGVTVGRGAVVAAGAVVVKDVPPLAVVAGNPARQVGSRPDDFSYRPGMRRTKLPWW